ncbi:hypothetical protein MTO96_029012 [Rhipicephalus appendiculatus]
MDDDEAQSKKPRLDENKFDDKTSTYDLSDEDDMGDDEPFTLVTYKKKRAEGIPVVFRPTSEGASFWQVNPNRVSAEIVSAAKEKVQSFRTTRDGSFSVSVASLASAKRLLMLANKCSDANVANIGNTTFARTVPSAALVVRSVTALLSFYDWRKFSIVQENSRGYETVAQSLEAHVKGLKGFTINSKNLFNSDLSCCELKQSCCQTTMTRMLDETYRKTRSEYVRVEKVC